MGAGSDVRIVGLDAWRAVLMTGGLFVHGSAWLAPTHLFYMVELVSQAFRMGVFFAISGFLAASTLRRTTPGKWFRRRLRQLGIPAMTGVLAISPLIWWLVATHPVRVPPEPPLVFEWAHIWFLWGLLLCSAALWLIDRRDPDGQVAARVAHARPLTLILGTALATAVMFAIVPPALRFVLTPRLVQAYANAQLIAGYLPTFLLGVLVARHGEAQARLLSAWRIAAAIVLATILCHAALGGGMIFGLEREIRFLGAALCPPAAFVLVLRSALAIRHVPDAVRSLTDASYTIYLLHVPVAVALNTRMAPLGLHPNLQYGVTIALGGMGCWACHRYVVTRSRTLALLLNGRMPTPRPSQMFATA